MGYRARTEDAVVGDRLPDGLGGRGYWLDMLGGDEGKVNAELGAGTYLM